jgi:hypothetical protein
LGYTSFLEIWSKCFPHVKIREYKAVSGKCDVCAALTYSRRQKLDHATRKYVLDLFTLHRSMYMGERLEYYKRRNDALIMPSSYMSLIADGMQQTHCILPWQGNLNTFSSTLAQHLQGVLIHGRSIEIYRTFHNISNCSNLSIHSLLLSLESRLRLEQKLPDTIYYQVDGGSENTSKSVLGICELIIARKLCKKIVLTRLPVGHTHEDIDSKFALIWKLIRGKFVITPQQYAAAVSTALTTPRLQCNVHDIFAIPDYDKYISPYIDKQLARYFFKTLVIVLIVCIRYAKRSRTGMDWTQLQWTFESVPVSDYFPCGVRTKYRKYSADEVIQIVPNADTPGGYDIFDLEIKDYPAAFDDQPEGMHVLERLPNEADEFVPNAFVQGSRQVLCDVVKAVENKWGRTQPLIFQDWKQFCDEVAPQSDDANEYCRTHGLKIPLKV